MLKDYVCVDLETTSGNPQWGRIIEIGAVKVRDGKVVEEFSELVNPECSVPDMITDLTGISTEMVSSKETIEVILPRFLEFAADDVLLGHNLNFDYSFLKQNANDLKLDFEKRGIDTLYIARKKLRSLESRGLEFLCNYFGINDPNHHRALNDASVTSHLYLILCDMFKDDENIFEPKELKYRPRKKQPITPKQARFLKNLIEYHNIEVDYEIEKLTKSEASRHIDQIISEKGRILY